MIHKPFAYLPKKTIVCGTPHSNASCQTLNLHMIYRKSEEKKLEMDMVGLCAPSENKIWLFMLCAKKGDTTRVYYYNPPLTIRSSLGVLLKHACSNAGASCMVEYDNFLLFHESMSPNCKLAHEDPVYAQTNGSIFWENTEIIFPAMQNIKPGPSRG